MMFAIKVKDEQGRESLENAALGQKKFGSSKLLPRINFLAEHNLLPLFVTHLFGPLPPTTIFLTRYIVQF